MEFFYPIGRDPENDSLLEQLPKGYKFAAKIFNPFIKMSNGWKSDNTDTQDYPSTKDILNYGEPVSWEEIQKKSGLYDISEMSIALTAAITGGGILSRDLSKT
ncbi:DUF2711 family protein [Fredinandcohnia sp. 179-A 10B2 NHS]|uniref:DUF2711 family protein n=1 Tax=Fredinandcohnia sp. 179-A 10B2 NHS TaxID=3235176 RepID=UPI0039A31AF5